ncbi:hypothetical protein KFE25_002148 [Diacronema lutheri]|uniref:Ketoreductase domain-containing protein n=1 Tax=Diacronema lutheri TaxID=2081491 RepID=A0A8J5XLM1_DIALT|nr:hypothetical protein KFE25_002148 [Diacronema lutheri]
MASMAAGKLLRFDGRVAIVTGAGAGLGRLYALDLASRGARVVVNDFSRAAADRTVAEIRAVGGAAAPDYADVANGEAVVRSALDAFGGVHIVVNNAGVLRDVSFARMTPAQWDAVLDTHLRGAFAVCKAAWGPMREQGYGRIVNVTSVNGLYGQVGQANYSAAKSAIVGFTKTLAQEGRSRGIVVNAVAPGAGTAMTATIMPPDLVEAWKPDYVAPFVTCLCHQDVPCSGCTFECGGGWAGEVKYTRSRGLSLDIGDPRAPGCPFGAEDFMARFGEVRDFAEGAVFPDEVKARNVLAENPQLRQVVSKL